MKKRRILKKGLAILLTAAMVVGLVPGMGTLQVSATESDENTVNTVSSNEAMTPEPTPEQTDGQATEKLITAWQWIDEEEILDEETGSLSLPGASEEMPAYFDDVTAFLPTRILATVENAEEPITLGYWECDSYPKEGAYTGSYTFTATLPEGYELSEEAEALAVLVELGGGSTFVVSTPSTVTLQPGQTLNVSGIPAEEVNPTKYCIDKNGTYTLTGTNYYKTAARFVITKDCTIILDCVDLEAGLTYEDNTEVGYYSGQHGVFEVDDNVEVTFELRNWNRITSTRYSYTQDIDFVSPPVIMLGSQSKVVIEGTGSLTLNGRIGRQIYSHDDGGLHPGTIVMKSGKVTIDGFGNKKVDVGGYNHYYSPKSAIEFIYEGGNFYNTCDDDSNLAKWSTSNSTTGCSNRVKITTNTKSGDVLMKIGAEGAFATYPTRDDNTLYVYHNLTQQGTVTDYYLMEGDNYRHFRNTYTGLLTEAVEVSDEASISGVKGTIMKGSIAAGGGTLTFQRDDMTFTCTVASDGTYNRAIPQGTYQVSFKPSGSDTVFDMGTVSLTSETEHIFDFTLSTLEGYVKDTNQNPLKGAFVTVQKGETEYSATSDSAGAYRIVLPKGFAETGDSLEVSVVCLVATSGTTATVTYQPGVNQKNFELTLSPSGTFEVYTEDDLVFLSNMWAQLGGNTINLMTDITLTGKFHGIEYSGEIAEMTLNGNGHSIKNMTKPLFYSHSAGLYKCSITDLHLSGNIAVNDVEYVGAIASQIINTQVKNCTFEGSIRGENCSYIGGLVGQGYIRENKNRSYLLSCFVHITDFDGTNVKAMGGLCGRLTQGSGSISNSGVLIDNFGGTMDTSSTTARGSFIGHGVSIGVFNCYSVVTVASPTVYRMNGFSGEKLYCFNTFSYAPAGVYREDEEGKVQATDLSLELVKAAAGSGTGDEEPLIDRLNTYASKNNYGTWYRRADGYPSPIRGKFTVTYAGGTKGTGSRDAVTVSQGDSVILPGEVFKNVDSFQKGWATTENGSKAYDFGASITPTDNMTLYPYWEAKPAAPCVAPVGLTATYGDTVGSISLPEGLAWNTPDALVGNVGTHTFTATYTPTDEEAENYGKNTNVQISVEVGKAPSAYTTPVSIVSDLTYNRTEQALVTAGTTSDGTIVYSLTKDGTYTTAIPTATKVGDYIVYYKIQGDANHHDSKIGNVSVSIGKGSLLGAVITLGASLTYNGEEQAQSVESVKVGDLVLAAGDYTVTGNTGTDAGTYTLTVRGQGNFEGSATKDFSIAKKSAISVADINKSYVHTAGSKDAAVSIDIAGLLPNDRGATTYSLADNAAAYITDESVDGDGKLTYKVGTNGSIGDVTALIVTANSLNYEAITVKVNINIVDKYILAEKEDAKVAITGSNTLIYGQALSTLTLNTDVAKFVENGDSAKEVTGTLAWETPDAILNVGTSTAKWVFTPDDTLSYVAAEGYAAITVKKATPDVTALPTVTARTYNPTVSLTDADLVGGTVTDIDGNSLDGSWSWQTAGIIPTVNNSGYVAVFTPTDSTNYETVTKTITVTVSKATPYIATAPTAAAITYGDTLGASILSGGTVQYSVSDAITVAGSFAWGDSSMKPSVSDSNIMGYWVVFTPSDADNYNAAETYVTLTVNKAENAPNMPSVTMNVANSCKKISDVTLPTDWVWQDADKNTALVVDMPVTATAVYNGEDKGNYENETVSVTITRSVCEHAHTEIRGAVSATCTAGGYTGDTYCTDCGALLTSGTTIPLADHQGGTATCTKKAVCTVCGKEYGELNANNHVHTEIRGVVAATCTAGGYTGDTYCTDCGVKTKTGTVTPALGHNFEEFFTVDVEPTTTTEGSKSKHCSRCDAKTEVTVIEKVITEKVTEDGHKTDFIENAQGWTQAADGNTYWYEEGLRQGYDSENSEYRGKEIIDPETNAWYWLDNVQGGAIAKSKDVYMESDAGIWAESDDGTGKWVRYDANGLMIKGWCSGSGEDAKVISSSKEDTDKSVYYFDLTYGTMAKGYASIMDADGVYREYHFDEVTGVLDRSCAPVEVKETGWVTVDGIDYWYEGYNRQGYKAGSLSYRGKEIYDPDTDAWYWLDNVDDGKKAVSKDVYQESLAGEWGDMTNEAGEKIGKWVRYDAAGHMVKGWSADHKYYFDPVFGTMAKGTALIDGRIYTFDTLTGVLIR